MFYIQTEVKKELVCVQIKLCFFSSLCSKTHWSDAALKLFTRELLQVELQTRKNLFSQALGQTSPGRTPALCRRSLSEGKCRAASAPFAGWFHLGGKRRRRRKTSVWRHRWRQSCQRTYGLLTLVGSWDEPQAAVVLGGVFQRDPHPHHSAQRLRVQECGILMWRHWEMKEEFLNVVHNTNSNMN